jgi:hypothetical protein
VESSLRAHCDDTMLVLVAIGEDSPSPVFDRHAQTCPDCRAKAADFAEVVNVAAESLSERAYSQPPASVWRTLAKEVEPAGTRPDLVVPLPTKAAPADSDPAAPASRRPVLIAVLLLIVALAVVLGLVLAT